MSDTYNITVSSSGYAFRIECNASSTCTFYGASGTYFYVFIVVDDTWTASSALFGSFSYQCGTEPTTCTVQSGASGIYYLSLSSTAPQDAPTMAINVDSTPGAYEIAIDATNGFAVQCDNDDCCAFSRNSDFNDFNAFAVFTDAGFTTPTTTLFGDSGQTPSNQYSASSQTYTVAAGATGTYFLQGVENGKPPPASGPNVGSIAIG